MANQEAAKAVVKFGMDQTGFQNGISAINRELRVVQSQFQAASAEVKRFGNTEGELRVKSDSLTRQIEVQKQKVELLQRSFEKSAEAKGKDAKATQDFEIKLNKAKAQLSLMQGELSKTNRELSQTASSFDKAGKEAEKSGGKFSKVTSLLGDLRVALVAAAGAALTAGATMGIKFNADMETAAMSFETLLGSAEKAQKMIADLQKFGAQTPFEFQGLQDSAKLMLAMGFSADSVMPNLTAIGNAVSAIGGNSETMNGVTMAMGQMLTKGKVSAEEMNQLAERGIPAWDLLSQKMGLSKAELMKLGEQGKLYSDQALPAMLDAMNTRYSGAMDKQSQTLTGQWSTFKDNLNMLLGEVSKPLFEALKKALPVAIDFINKLSDAFKNGGFKGMLNEIFPPNVTDTLIVWGETLGAVIKLLVNNWPTIKPILGGLVSIMQPAFIFVPMIKKMTEDSVKFFESVKGKVVEFKTGVSTTLDQLSAKVSAFFEPLKIVSKAGLEAIKTIFATTLLAIWSIVTGRWDQLGQIFQKGKEKLVSITSGALNDLGQIWNSGIGKITSFVSNLWENIKSAFTSGGNQAKTDVSNTLSNIGSLFSNLPERARAWGRNMIQGFVDGIKSMAKPVVDAVGGVIGWAADYIKFQSPAKKGEGRNIVKWGSNMIYGFLDGVNAAVPRLQATMDGVIQPPKLITSTSLGISGSSPQAIGGNSATNHFNFEGILKGATLVVREEADIPKLAKQLGDYMLGQARKNGVVFG